MAKANINSTYRKKIKVRNPFPLIASSLWNSSFGNTKPVRIGSQKVNESCDYNDTGRLSKVNDIKGLTINYSPSTKYRKLKLDPQFYQYQKKFRSPKSIFKSFKNKLPVNMN